MAVQWTFLLNQNENAKYFTSDDSLLPFTGFELWNVTRRTAGFKIDENGVFFWLLDTLTHQSFLFNFDILYANILLAWVDAKNVRKKQTVQH